MGVQIYQKPEGTPSSNDIFIFETTTGSVHFDKRVKWTTLMGLIAAINDLQNYYLKSETYTKTEVNQLIAAIPTFSIEIVNQLPTTDISTTTIYLTPKQDAGTLDYYDEWINLDGTTSGWEWLGKTQVDLSNYYTKAETETYVKGNGADYIVGTKTYNSLNTTAKKVIDAINEVKQTADGAASTATSAGQTATAAQGTADAAANAAAAAQQTANGKSTVTVTEGQATGSTLATITVDGTPYVVRQVPADATLDGTSTNALSNAAAVAGLEAKADLDDDVTDIIVALTDEQTTAPGNPVTLTTEQSGGAKSALVTFAPKQSGTGDPSPSNIRPISGWDSLNLDVSGKNLFSASIEQGGVYSSGGLQNRSDRCRTTTQEVVSGATYTASVKTDENIRIIGAYYYNSSAPSGSTFVSRDTNTSKVITFTVPQFAQYVLLSFANDTDQSANITPSDVQELQIELGSQATAYEPYQGETHTATFPSTIMGGSYDFVSGEGSEAWEYIASYAGETLPGEWMSDRDVYAEGATPTTGAEVAYVTATPQEITLTPEDVNLLKGSNTVWTDGDTVQVKYSELPNGNLGAVIDYIKKLEARVKALES